MFYVLCLAICFFGDYFYSVNLARFMFCYLLHWQAIIFSVNLAWFMFYVLCLFFTTFILRILSSNSLLYYFEFYRTYKSKLLQSLCFMFYLSSLSETRVQVSTIFYYDYDLCFIFVQFATSLFGF